MRVPTRSKKCWVTNSEIFKASYNLYIEFGMIKGKLKLSDLKPSCGIQGEMIIHTYLHRILYLNRKPVSFSVVPKTRRQHGRVGGRVERVVLVPPGRVPARPGRVPERAHPGQARRPGSGLYHHGYRCMLLLFRSVTVNREF